MQRSEDMREFEETRRKVEQLWVGGRDAANQEDDSRVTELEELLERESWTRREAEDRVARLESELANVRCQHAVTQQQLQTQAHEADCELQELRGLLLETGTVCEELEVACCQLQSQVDYYQSRQFCQEHQHHCNDCHDSQEHPHHCNPSNNTEIVSDLSQELLENKPRALETETSPSMRFQLEQHSVAQPDEAAMATALEKAELEIQVLNTRLQNFESQVHAHDDDYEYQDLHTLGLN
eukprot:TRINITY_DN49488_c0_g1_i1.p1 TRINITY_DN49488_c0_g1~~TRINITY_DN49488_c0_g1_i1.p1  ORF type:complete len:239 (-),score=38.36 TRINITY_DN49488_c0_g1_i1:280-996(-)